MKIFNFDLHTGPQRAQLTHEFSHCAYATISHGLSPNFLAHIQSLITESPSAFKERQYQNIGSDLVFTHNLGILKINSVFNQNEVLSFFSSVTGKTIKKAEARISKLQTGMELSWHDDSGAPKRVATLRIEMSQNTYKGGVFKLRDMNSLEILTEQGQGEVGDVYLFKVQYGKLEHCVEKVESGERISVIVWFEEA